MAVVVVFLEDSSLVLPITFDDDLDYLLLMCQCFSTTRAALLNAQRY